jgi:hypothetical protein
MADYSQITLFTPKDSLTTGDPNKKIRGAQLDPEFQAIATAISSKFDTDDIASQAEAAALSTNSKLMTPARLAYALQNATLTLGAGISLEGTETFPNVNSPVTASDEELNILDGATLSTAELNILDGVTSSTAELNILDGVTATAAEINKLDGLIASTAELNAIAGISALAHGTYTPDFTAVAGCSIVSENPAIYMRVGDTVQVSGSVGINVSSSGATITFRCTLPVASDFTVSTDASGVLTHLAVNDSGIVQADPTNNQLSFSTTASSTGARTLSFTAQYRVK